MCTLLDVLDIFVSTEGIEGVGVELASNAIEDIPAKMFSSSEREASEAAKTLSSDGPQFNGLTMFGLRATMYVVGVDMSLSTLAALMIGRATSVLRWPTARG